MLESPAVSLVTRKRLTPPPFSFRPLLKRASILVETDPESACQIAEKALDRYYHQPERDPEDLLQILEILVSGYWKQQHYHKAISALEAALDQYQESGDTAAEAEARISRGALLTLEGHHAPAINSYRKARELARERGDKVSEARVELYIGEVYDRMDQYPPALQHYLKSLVLIERENPAFRDLLEHCVQNIGKIYAEVGEFGKALDYWKIARECADEGKDARKLAEVTLDMAIAQVETRQFDEARKNLDTCLEVFRTDRDEERTIIALRKLAEAHLAAGSYERAWEQCEYALDLIGRDEHPGAQAAFMLLLVKIFSDPQNPLYEPQNAFEHAATGVEMAKRAGDVRTEALIHLHIAQLHERRSEMAEAVQHLRRYSELNEQLLEADWNTKRDNVRIAVQLEALRQHYPE